jgi:hypothetical protein
MYAQKDQDGTSVVSLRLLSEHSGCGEQPVGDVRIEKAWRIFGPRGYCGRPSVLLG